MSRIDDKYAIKLLRVNFIIDKRLKELRNFGVDVDGFSVIEEIMDVILDSYGFPRDSTSTKQQKHDGQPIFCRDGLYESFFESVKEGSDDELSVVLDEWKNFAKDKSSFYWTEEKHH